MWRAQEDDAVCGHVDGAVVLVVGDTHAVRVLQGSLHENATETVCHPDNGVPHRLLTLSISGEKGDQGLRMLVDVVAAGARAVLLG